MPSVLKTLLDNLQSKIAANTGDISSLESNVQNLGQNIATIEGNITTINQSMSSISDSLSSVSSEVTTARGDQASLDARLDAMTTATSNAADAASAAQTAAEAAQSDATSAQTTANEAATNANTANSNIAAAAGSFDSLEARLDDMTTDITNAADDASAATTDIAEINTEIINARNGFASLSKSIGAASFSGLGKALNNLSKNFWMDYTSNNTNYYTASGEPTTSGDSNAAYTITKVNNNPVTLAISIANILTVTSDTLLPSSLAPITVDGAIYTIYFIRLPNMEFNTRYAINSSYLNSFPVVAGSANPKQITMDMIGNINSTGEVSLTTENANLYIPILRPSTSPGTVFKFLYPAIDPDTNTVQYLTYNSSITVFL